MKVAAPEGGLAVFGLDGKLRQFLKGADRPNNVDVEYRLDLDGTPTDIAVLTERLGRRLRGSTDWLMGEPGRPHDHPAVLFSFTGGADGTDGLEATSACPVWFGHSVIRRYFFLPWSWGTTHDA